MDNSLDAKNYRETTRSIKRQAISALPQILTTDTCLHLEVCNEIERVFKPYMKEGQKRVSFTELNLFKRLAL